MRTAKLNKPFTFFLQLDQDDNAQYPTAVIMDESGAITNTINLALVPSVGGKYKGSLTFTTKGDYSIKYIVYADAARTTINKKYRFGDETVQVSDLDEKVDAILVGEIGDPIADFD